MLLRYGLDDAARWAAFSGDDNPIHFDVVKARGLGLEGVCIQGMRAMLDLKPALSRALQKHAPSSDGVLFRCRLREPVACGLPWQRVISDTSRQGQPQIGGQLQDPHTQQIAVSSKLVTARALSLPSVNQVSRLDQECLTALYARFLAVGSPAAPQWSFLDAVLFRQLLNAPATLDSVRDIVPQYDVASLCDVFRRVQVVQTHHEVHFSPRLLADITEDIESFDYAIQPTLVMGDKEAGLVLLAGVQAWRADVPLIAMTVTLKTGPLQALITRQ